MIICQHLLVTVTTVYHHLFTYVLCFNIVRIIACMGIFIILFTFYSLRLVVVQSLRCVQLPMTPWTAACQDSLSVTFSQSLLKVMSIESMIPSNHLNLSLLLLLMVSVFLSISVFFKESAIHIRWSKYWSFSFSISHSNKHAGLISFRTDSTRNERKNKIYLF